MLNLPATIRGKKLSYIYDATGRKLRKVSNGTVTSYIDGVQYTGGTIDFVQTEEGRVNNPTTSPNYEYTLTDHLGNNRVSFDQVSGKVGEEDYYPFGWNIDRQLNAGNKYLYNKKELQDGLNGQLDYGARFYDPVIARWTTIDPLAELGRRFSPYNYVENNPLRNIDPDGMWKISPNGYFTDDPAEISSVIESLQNGQKDGGQDGGKQGGDREKGIMARDVNQVRPDMRPSYPGSNKNAAGQLIYTDGVVQNLLQGTGNEYVAVFTDRQGNKIRFPGVYVTNEMVSQGAGMTLGSTIHLDTDGINGLVDLEHEYGHNLDILHNFSDNSLYFFIKVGIPSLYSALKETDFNHTKQIYEMRATKLAIDFFGSNSAIAKANKLYAR